MGGAAGSTAEYYAAMRCRLFRALSIFSIVLYTATVVLWVRSHSAADVFVIAWKPLGDATVVAITSDDGIFAVTKGRQKPASAPEWPKVHYTHALIYYI